MLFERCGAYTHNGDRDLLLSLGLKADNFGRDWTDLGTVIVSEAEPDGEFGPKPASTIKVEVSAYPAQFWRFTITTPRDECEDIPDDAPPQPHEQGNSAYKRWRAVYEPVEVYRVRTGSGGFSRYWPMAREIAEHMVIVERLAPASRDSRRPSEETS
jgi:hypothetical protein